MQYLLLCCFDERKWQALPDAQRDTIMRDYGALLKTLDETGVHLSGAQLQPTATATTVRDRDGKATATDGPFAETKEHLGGYHLIECGSLAEAIEIAQRIPTIPFGGAVEVRPLVQRQPARTGST